MANSHGKSGQSRWEIYFGILHATFFNLIYSDDNLETRLKYGLHNLLSVVTSYDNI